MNRLKFLVFALIALGLWVAHLVLLSPALGAALVDQATRQAVGAPAAVALRLESSRSELQAAVLRLASTPAITNPGPKTGKPEAPTADRFTQVRGAVMEALPEALRDKAIVGITNDVGALMAKGAGDAAAATEGFDPKVAGGSGGKGEVMDVGGVAFLVYSVPIFSVERGEVKGVAAAFVGLPLVPEPQALVDSVAKDLGLSALGLSVGGKVVASAGAQKALVDEVLKAAKPGQAMAAEKGAALALGPVKLPLLTAGDPLGGQATLELGVRRDIPGTPYEVVAVASLRPAMEALGGYQKTALFIFFGLLAAAIAFTLLIGGGAAAAEEDDNYVGPRAPVPVPAQAAERAAAKLPIADAPPPPEASADDFQFGPASPASPRTSEVPAMQRSTHTQEAPAFEPPGAAEEPSEDPFAALGGSTPAPPPPPQRAPPPVMTLGDEGDDAGQRTTSYPAHGYKNPMSMASTQSNPAVDPFAQAGGMMSQDEQMQGDNPDATRVAIIPQELLKASARGNSKENPMGAMPKVSSAPMPRVATAVAPAATGEEAHFQEVFRDFVATREKCGEPADGLTFDKFVGKLRKNKEQLVVKYNCKTVRFQVYVKEGKAALKATPVKE